MGISYFYVVIFWAAILGRLETVDGTEAAAVGRVTATNSTEVAVVGRVAATDGQEAPVVGRVAATDGQEAAVVSRVAATNGQEASTNGQETAAGGRGAIAGISEADDEEDVKVSNARPVIVTDICVLGHNQQGLFALQVTSFDLVSNIL